MAWKTDKQIEMKKEGDRSQGRRSEGEKRKQEKSLRLTKVKRKG